jgi:ubiquinone/menaquinone biosynthesis C-methylase UbiE
MWTTQTLNEVGQRLAEANLKALHYLLLLSNDSERNDWLSVGVLLDRIRIVLRDVAVMVSLRRIEFNTLSTNRYLQSGYAHVLLTSYCFSPTQPETVIPAVQSLVQLLRWLLYEQQVLFDLPLPSDLDILSNVLQTTRFSMINLTPEAPHSGAVYNESLAAIYDRLRPMHIAMVDGLRMLGARWMQNKDVLELGAGTGRIGLQIIPFVHSYMGIEFSPAMLEQFRQKLTSRHLPTTYVRLGDAMVIDLPDESVDVVFEHEVLMFVANPIKAVSESLRALRTGGTFIRIVVSSVGTSITELLFKAFEDGVVSVTDQPFMVVTNELNTWITEHLSSKGMISERSKLAEWMAEISLSDVIDRIKYRAYPYLRDLSDEALAVGLNSLWDRACSLGLHQLEELFGEYRQMHVLFSYKREM